MPHLRTVPLLTIAAIGMASAAQAADRLGFYIGAGVGHGRLNTDVVRELGIPPEAAALGSSFLGRLDETHTRWTFLVGFRPVSLAGAELKYIEFGRTTDGIHSNTQGYAIDVAAKAIALLGVFYVPQPLPFVDFYGKAGVARLKIPLDGHVFLGHFCTLTNNVCNWDKHVDRTDACVTYGAGAQVKLSSFAVRAEYEKIQQSGGSPDLVSLGVTWTL